MKQGMDGYIGQDRLRPLIMAELKTGRPFRHTLVYGASGIGKTKLATVIGHEAGCEVETYYCSREWDAARVASMLLGLDISGYDERGNPGPGARRYCVILDEVHELRGDAWEAWYPVLAEGHVYLDGQPNWLPELTILSCTTEIQDVPKPFRDRHPLQLHLDPYTDSQIEAIIQLNYPKMKPDIVAEIARRSRRTPRIALSYAQTVNLHGGALTLFDVLEIDAEGFGPLDRRYMDALRLSPSGYLSLGQLASVLGETRETLETVVEPYLVSKGMVAVSSRGRSLIAHGGRGRREGT